MRPSFTGTTPKEMMVSRAKSSPVASKSKRRERHMRPRHPPPGGRRRLGFRRHDSSPQPELGGQGVLLALDHPERLLQALPRERTERARCRPGRRARRPSLTCRVWCSSRICHSSRNASSSPRRRSSSMRPRAVTSCSRRSVRFSVSPDMTARTRAMFVIERDAAVLHVERDARSCLWTRRRRLS